MIERKKQNICGVCHIKIHNKSIQYETTQPLQCLECRQFAHKYCYQPNAKILGFKCQVCTYLKEDKPLKVKCNYCNGSDGIFKRLGFRKYVHVLCAIFSNNFVVKEYSSLTLLQITDKSSENIKKAGKCSICLKKLTKMERRGLNVCGIDKCSEKVHSVCAFLQNNECLGEGGWDIRRINSSQWYNTLFFNYLEDRNPQINEIIWKDNPKQKQLLFGDRSHSLGLICREHNKNIELPCLCGRNLETTWVQCSNCFQWSHTQCQKTSIQEVNFDENSFFTCYQCTVWQQIVNNNLLPHCNSYPMLHFYDYVFIHTYYENKMYKMSKRDFQIIETFPIPPSLVYYSQYCQKVIYPLVKNSINIPKSLSVTDLQAKCQEDQSIDNPSETNKTNMNNIQEQSNEKSKIKSLFPQTFSIIRILLSQNFQFKDNRTMKAEQMVQEFKKRYMDVNNIAIRIESDAFSCRQQGKGLIQGIDNKNIDPKNLIGQKPHINEKFKVQNKNNDEINNERQKKDNNGQFQCIVPLEKHYKYQIVDKQHGQIQKLSTSNVSKSKIQPNISPQSVNMTVVVKEIDQISEPVIFSQKFFNPLRFPIKTQLNFEQNNELSISNNKNNNTQVQNKKISEIKQGNLQNKFLNVISKPQIDKISQLHDLFSSWNKRQRSDNCGKMSKFRKQYQESDIITKNNCIYLKKMADIAQIHTYDCLGSKILNQVQIQQKIWIVFVKKWLSEQYNDKENLTIKYSLIKKLINIKQQAIQLTLNIYEFIINFFPKKRKLIQNQGINGKEINQIDSINQLSQNQRQLINSFLLKIADYNIAQYPKSYKILRALGIKIIQANIEKKIKSSEMFKVYSIIYEKFEIGGNWLKNEIDKNVKLDRILSHIDIKEFLQPSKLVFRKDCLRKSVEYCVQNHINYRLQFIYKHISWYNLYEQCIKYLPLSIFYHTKQSVLDIINQEDIQKSTQRLMDAIKSQPLPSVILNQDYHSKFKLHSLYGTTNEKISIDYYKLTEICLKMEIQQFPLCNFRQIVFKIHQCAENEVKTIQNFIKAFSQRIQDPHAETQVYSKIQIFNEIQRLNRSKFNFYRHISEARQILTIDQQIQMEMIKALKINAFNKYRELNEKLLVIPFEISQGIFKKQSESVSDTELQSQTIRESEQLVRYRKNKMNE